MPVTGVTRSRIGHVDAAGPRDPAELGVEDQEAHQARARRSAPNSRQAEHPDDLVDEAAALHGREHAERNAEQDADQRAEGRELERRRERPGGCRSSTGLEVRTELPKSPVSTFLR